MAIQIASFGSAPFVSPNSQLSPWSPVNQFNPANPANPLYHDRSEEKEKDNNKQKDDWKIALAFFLTFASMAIGLALFALRGKIWRWWKNRGKKDDGDDGGGTIGSGGSRTPATRVPPESGGVASRIAEVRQIAVTIDSIETAEETRSGIFSPVGFFRTALMGIRNIFSPQIQMPSPVLVPVNVMPLGTFNPFLTAL